MGSDSRERTIELQALKEQQAQMKPVTSVGICIRVSPYRRQYMNHTNKNIMVFQLTQNLFSLTLTMASRTDYWLWVVTSVDRLILAYSNGIFPMLSVKNRYNGGVPETVCDFPNEIHISHSMRTLMNKGRYGVSFNQAFLEVIQTR